VITKPRERGGHSPRWAAEPMMMTTTTTTMMMKMMIRIIIITFISSYKPGFNFLFYPPIIKFRINP
jgi:predicted Zn-dependent protease